MQDQTRRILGGRELRVSSPRKSGSLNAHFSLLFTTLQYQHTNMIVGLSHRAEPSIEAAPVASREVVHRQLQSMRSAYHSSMINDTHQVGFRLVYIDNFHGSR